MIGFIVRRFLYMIPLLWLVSVIAFFIIWLQPGDFVTRFKLNPNFSREFIEQLEKSYGLDKSPVEQYVLWLKGIVCCTDLIDTTDPGNPKHWKVWSFEFRVDDKFPFIHGFPFVHFRPYFGHSFEQRMPVSMALFGKDNQALIFTAVVLLATMLFIWLFAIPVGIYSATHKYSVADHSLTFLGFLGLSIPNFLLALFFLELMVQLQVGQRLGLGIGKLLDGDLLTACWVFGTGNTCGAWWNVSQYNWSKIVNFLWHLWPVIIIVGAANVASLMRYMRGNLLDVLGEPYVQTARAKGLTERVVVYKHAVRNAINPLVSMLGFWIPLMFEGMIVTAAVLDIQVVELNYWQALSNEDQPVILAGLLFFGVILLVGNLLSDILLALVDPKIRYE